MADSNIALPHYCRREANVQGTAPRTESLRPATEPRPPSATHELQTTAASPVSADTSKLSKLRVVLATSRPSLLESYDKACHQLFAGGYSWEFYRDFMQKLRTEAGRELGPKEQVFCLIDPVNEDEVLSGVSTVPLKALYRSRGKTDISRGYVYRLVSNITPRQHQGQGFNRNLLRAVHRALADPSFLEGPPNEKDPRVVLTDEERSGLPYARASYLRTGINSSHYEKSTVWHNGPGWRLVSSALQPMTWWAITERDTPTMEQAAAEEGWTILYEPTGQNTLLRVNPASPGVLMEIHQRNILLIPEEASTFEAAPIGLKKGNTITLLSRYYEGQADTLVITHMQGLEKADVSSWTKVIGAMTSGTHIREVMIFDLDPQSDVAKVLEGTQSGARYGPASGITIPPLMMIHYSGILSDDAGSIDDEQRQVWL